MSIVGAEWAEQAAKGCTAAEMPHPSPLSNAGCCESSETALLVSGELGRAEIVPTDADVAANVLISALTNAGV